MNTEVSNTPAKKQWITPKIIMISKGTVEGGANAADQEANYHAHYTPSIGPHYHKNNSSSTRILPATYNDIAS